MAAMVVIDAVSRLVPGVVGDEDSVREDTFSDWLLKHPAVYAAAQLSGA